MKTDELGRTIQDVKDNYPESLKAERVEHNWFVLTKLEEPVIGCDGEECPFELVHYWTDSRTPESWDIKSSSVYHYSEADIKGYDDENVSLFDLFRVT